ncbi:MAG: glycosyltransferase family 2 protein [Phycisphaeraceae bacterium JB051]
MNFPVSVIIPCHNAQQWLPGTLASVAAQTHKPEQVILVADRCTDESVNIAREFDLPIQIIETDFGNAGPARNAGVALADSQWVALLDADDHWLANHLADAASLLHDTDHVAYCAGHRFMDNNDQPFPLPACFWQGWAEPHTQLTDTDYVQLMLKGMHFGHSTVVYRKERFDQVAGFNPQQVRRHDIDLWLRMIHEHHWAYHPGPAAHYRNQTPGSISRNMVEVTYYQLRALLLNEEAYAHTDLHRMIDAYARRAASVAFGDATGAWRDKLYEIATPKLPANYQRAYRVMRLCPWFFKAMIWMKRQTIGRVSAAAKAKRDQQQVDTSTPTEVSS